MCLLTKPAEDKGGYPLDAEKLFALRTEYIGDPAAVSGVLDALGIPEIGGEYGLEQSVEYEYYIQLETAQEPYGVRVFHVFKGESTGPWNNERNLEMWMRGYVALALIGNAEWVEWQPWFPSSPEPVGEDDFRLPIMYADTYREDIDAARQSVEGLRAFIDKLEQEKADGTLKCSWRSAVPGVDMNPCYPDASKEITPWPSMGENDPRSVKAEDYGIVYDAEQLPDWETVPLSYLCAYYLNADGAYAEGAMDTLMARYEQAPNTVLKYIRTVLTGRADPKGRGDASEVLLQDISRYAMSQLTGGLPVAASYERDQLSISVSEVYSVTYRTVTYDENYSEDIPVYEVGSGAQLSVIKGEGFTLYGRHNEENVALHNGDVVELTEQFVGLGMDGQYAVRFQYRSAAETAEKTTLSFNDNGAGMVSYPAYVFRGSGYAITVLGNAWHQMTLGTGWTDIGVDGSPAINGKPAEVWQSTEDINTQLAVVHLGAMTLKEAQEWSKGAAGDGFTLTESKQGDMSGDGKNGPTEMYWTCAFYGTDSDRLAVIKTYPVAQTEHLGYALNAMADTFTLT